MPNARELVTMELTLERVEWCELANALDSKIHRVDQGDYGEVDEPGDNAKWLADLRGALNKLSKALEDKGVSW